MKKTVSLLALWILSSMLICGTAYATDIYGTIASTLTIYNNSRLTGDVTCTVTGAPCIVFGAPGITLHLNGHTITGQGPTGSDRGDLETCVSGEDAINTNWQPKVEIQGPGLIGEFRETGIIVSGQDSNVSNVVVSSMCEEGIRLLGHHNTVDQSIIVRASLSGGFFASIFVSGGGYHIVTGNQTIGAGPAPQSTNTGNLGGHGIFVGGLNNIPSNNNVIKNNIASGNPGTGIFIADPTTGYPTSTGNVIDGNTAFGNVLFHDIFDNNAAGSNTYHNNLCEFSGGTDAPYCPKLQ